MILSKEDLNYYLEADRLALRKQNKSIKIYGDEIWKFQRLLRSLEYYQNCRKTGIYVPAFLYLKLRYHHMGVRLSYTIPPNVFGPGLSIAHIGTIVVSPFAKIGNNCRIHACVNIGTAADKVDEAPIIGDNVYIGPGAKLFGRVIIADNIAIGANAVVNKSFIEPGITIAGVPAKKVSDQGSERMLVKATELLNHA